MIRSGRRVNKYLSWFFFMTLWGMLAYAQSVGAAEPALLFSPVASRTASAQAVGEEDSLYLRERTAILDKNLLFGTRSMGDGRLAPGSTVRFNLFDDVVLDITPLKQERVNRGRTRIWVGHILGQEHSEAILAATGESVAGNIRTESGELYQVRHVSGAVHQVRQVDGTQYPVKNCPPCRGRPKASTCPNRPPVKSARFGPARTMGLFWMSWSFIPLLSARPWAARPTCST